MLTARQWKVNIQALFSPDLSNVRKDDDRWKQLKKNLPPGRQYIRHRQDDGNEALCSEKCVIVATRPRRSVIFSPRKAARCSAWGAGSRLISARPGGLVSRRSRPGASTLTPRWQHRRGKASAGAPSLLDPISPPGSWASSKCHSINHVEFIYFDHLDPPHPQ